MSSPALLELDALRAEAEESCALVFTTTGQTPVSWFGKLKRRLDQLSDVRDWRLHDLRTAFASHGAEAGIAEGVVDRVLNHVASASSVSAVARVYQRSELLAQRAEALDRWAVMVTGSSAAPLRWLTLFGMKGFFAELGSASTLCPPFLIHCGR